MKIRTAFMAKIVSKRKETRSLLSGKPTWRAKKIFNFYLKNEVLSQSLGPAQSARLSRHFSRLSRRFLRVTVPLQQVNVGSPFSLYWANLCLCGCKN